MIQLITTEIELSQDEIKEAIEAWLYKKGIDNDEMKIEFNYAGETVSPTAKITFTKK